MTTPFSRWNRRKFLRSTLSVSGSIGILGIPGILSTAPNPGNPLSNTLIGNNANAPRLKEHSQWDQSLVADPKGLLDLPEELNYRVISESGELMDDGLITPIRPDGMGVFEYDSDRLILVRNHETGDFKYGNHIDESVDPTLAYMVNMEGKALSGGTTTIVLDKNTLNRLEIHRSLAGTVNNCAGGETPWGTWISCEESDYDDHGYAFEIDPKSRHLSGFKRLTAMGRFEREAVAIDPKTSICYQTEDHDKGLFYRFIPKTFGDLASKGKLEALKIAGFQGQTTRFLADGMKIKTPYKVEWVAIEDPEAMKARTLDQGAEAGAHCFNGGEGVIADVENELIYFVNKNGGRTDSGQVWKYHIPEQTIELFYDSEDPAKYWAGDNLYIAPWGDLLVCEDHDDEPCRVIGFKANGATYTLASCPLIGDELAGLCFSPTTNTMFINVQDAGKTLAIDGDWTAIENFAKT